MVCFPGSDKVLFSTMLCLYQMITVNCGGDGDFFLPCLHKLKKSHLCSGILHSYAVRQELNIIITTLKILLRLILIQMRIKDLFSKSQRFPDEFSDLSDPFIQIQIK